MATSHFFFKPLNWGSTSDLYSLQEVDSGLSGKENVYWLDKDPTGCIMKYLWARQEDTVKESSREAAGNSNVCERQVETVVASTWWSFYKDLWKE